MRDPLSEVKAVAEVKGIDNILTVSDMEKVNYEIGKLLNDLQNSSPSPRKKDLAALQKTFTDTKDIFVKLPGNLILFKGYFDFLRGQFNAANRNDPLPKEITQLWGRLLPKYEAIVPFSEMLVKKPWGVFIKNLTHFKEHINPAYFLLTPEERLKKLKFLSHDSEFLPALATNHELAAAFLKKSVNEQPELISSLGQNPLGENFLSPVRGLGVVPVQRVVHHLNRFNMAFQPNVMQHQRAQQHYELELQKVGLTEVFNKDKKEHYEKPKWMRKYSCPITLGLIVNEVGSLKLTNNTYQYYDYVELLKWIVLDGKDPLTRLPIKKEEVQLATKAYRIEFLKDYVQYELEGTAADEVRKCLESYLKQVAWPKELINELEFSKEIEVSDPDKLKKIYLM